MINSDLNKLLKDYDQKYTNLQYDEAVALSQLLTDKEYENFYEINSEILEKGLTKTKESLDQLIKALVDFISNKIPNIDSLSENTLNEYSKSLIDQLSYEDLKEVTNFIKSKLY